MGRLEPKTRGTHAISLDYPSPKGRTASVQTLLRLAKLRQRLTDLGADGAVISSRENVAYLTGFAGSAGTLVVAPGKAFLLTDGRYAIRARALARGYNVTLGKSPAQVINELPGRPTIMYEQSHMTDGQRSALEADVKRATLAAESRILEEIRAVKDAAEVDLVEKAVLIGDKGWEELQPYIVPGVTEVELANRLEATMKDMGASGTSFDSIIASGPNSAIPHHETSDRVLQDGEFVKCDFGCTYKGYRSDMTRTVFLGEPTDKHREVYNAVYRAQVESAAMIAPGVEGEAVAGKAREIIKEAGYDKNYTHGLGHGVGRDIHELPGVGKGTTFEPGHIVTVEPGIYIEGWGGVRIEDCVLVTRAGSRALTTSPKPEWPEAPGWK